MAIADRIKAARIEVGLTQKELAKKCDISVITIHQYETSKRIPRIDILQKIAFALNVTVSDLVEDEYWKTVSPEEYRALLEDNPKKHMLLTYFGQLNEAGQDKAVERVQELTDVPKYRADIYNDGET